MMFKRYGNISDVDGMMPWELNSLAEILKDLQKAASKDGTEN